MFHSILAKGPTFWMPQQSSTVAGDVDWVYYLVYWVNVIFFLLVISMMVWFVIRYRHRKGQPKHEATAGHSTALELTWTIVPTIIVIVIFYYGFRGYLALAVEPPNAYEITATGKMWNWSFTYPNGYVSPELHVPADTPVRLVLTSDDVLHSLFIPDFRVKKDVVPGRFNRLWFQASKMDKTSTTPEEHDLYCTEYCGTNHSAMITKAVVHDPTEFRAWLEGASNWEGKMSPIQAGAELYKSRGCAQCHSVDGMVVTGPTWKDLYGSDVKLTNGQTVVADEAYIRESILYPNAKIHQGFQPVMPSYLGSMKERDINALIAYMKSISENFEGDLAPLKQTAPPSPEGGKTAK